MTGDKVDKATMTYGNREDIWVANKVRMLMRDDLDHEFVCVGARDRIMYLSQEVERLTALCDEYRGEIERLKVDCECHRIQAVDRGNSYQKAAAEIERLTGELQAYRDEETCMCGSPIKTHTMGDGHSPVSVMDYRLGQLVEGEQGLQAALTRARAEGMEEAAVIAETISMPSFGSDAKWDGYEMATEDIASAIRLAKDKL